MEHDAISIWKKSINEHIDRLNTLVDDRKILKKQIEEHLSQCFQWDDIEYNRDFSIITLKWAYGHSPVIKAENISNLGMDWIISASYDDVANRIIVIEIYPWGVKEGLQDP